jgi:hypothetical protein
MTYESYKQSYRGTYRVCAGSHVRARNMHCKIHKPLKSEGKQ